MNQLSDTPATADTGQELGSFLPEFDAGKERLFIGIVCLVSLFIQLLAIFWADFGVYRNDDAYYYFQIAKNFPTTGNLTFDGIHLTNGVQPLFAVILCIISALLYPFSLEPMILAKFFLASNAFFNVAAGCFFYRFGTRAGHRGLAWLLLLFFLFGSFPLRNQLIGMENSLYAMMLGVFLSEIIPMLKKDGEIGLRKAVIAGILGGLLFLTRVDSIFMLIIFGVWILVVRRDGGFKSRFRAGLKSVAVIAFASFLTVLPYLIYNYVYFGHLFPISGSVKAYYSSQYAAHNFGGMFTASYFMHILKLLVSLFGPLLFKVTESLKSWFLGYPYHILFLYESSGLVAKLIFILPLFALAVLTIVHYARKPRHLWVEAFRSFKSIMKESLPLFTFAAVQLIISTFLYPIYVNYSGLGWWFIPSHCSIAIILLALMNGILSLDRELVSRKRAILIIAVALVALNSFGYVYSKSIKSRNSTSIDYQKAKYHAALWINDNMPEDAVIGALNAGILGFYCERTVVNLDGLVNDFEFLEILKKNNVHKYMIDNNIGYLADYLLKSRVPPTGTFKGIPVAETIYAEPFDYPANSIFLIYAVGP